MSRPYQKGNILRKAPPESLANHPQVSILFSKLCKPINLAANSMARITEKLLDFLLHYTFSSGAELGLLPNLSTFRWRASGSV